MINYPLSEKRFPTCKSVASYLQIAKCKCNCKCNCKSLASHLQVTCNLREPAYMQVQACESLQSQSVGTQMLRCNSVQGPTAGPATTTRTIGEVKDNFKRKLRDYEDQVQKELKDQHDRMVDSKLRTWREYQEHAKKAAEADDETWAKISAESGMKFDEKMFRKSTGRWEASTKHSWCFTKEKWLKEQREAFQPFVPDFVKRDAWSLPELVSVGCKQEWRFPRQYQELHQDTLTFVRWAILLL